MIKAILAVGGNGEIGQKGDMPWGRGLPKDLEYFKKKTLYQNVLIGRKTFNTLPFNGKGFPKRDTLVLTRNLSYEDPILSSEGNVFFFSEEELKEEYFSEQIWVAGGSETYKTFSHLIGEYHITRVKASFPEADTFFEPDLTGFEKVGVDKDVSGEYSAFVEVWRRIQ